MSGFPRLFGKTQENKKKQNKKQTKNNTVWSDVNVNVAKSRQFCRTDEILLQTRST